MPKRSKLVQQFTLSSDDLSCQVDGKANHLVRDGQSIAMQAKAMELLIFLAQNQGEVVSREQIISEVWQGTAVVDNAVTNAIAKIRKALGKPEDGKTILETVPKVGYRLMAEVTWQDDVTKDAAPVKSKLLPVVSVLVVIVVLLSFALEFWFRGVEQWPANQISLPKVTSLALLPFKESGPEPVPLHISQGVAQGIRAQLSQQSTLRVAAQSSSSTSYLQALSIADIARELGVNALLRGTIEQKGSLVTIKLTLVDGQSNQPLFQFVHSRSQDQLVELQQDMTTDVLAFLQLNQKPTVINKGPDFAAYDLYLLGRFHLKNRDIKSLEKAIVFFQQAITVDPNMALAYSGLANAYVLATNYGNLSMAEAEKKAEPAIYKALSLNNQLAEAHASQGLLRSLFGDSDDAVRAFQRAIDLDSNNVMATLWLGGEYRDQFKYDLANEAYQKALSIDPLNLVILSSIANLKLDRGEYVQGVNYYNKLFTLDPKATPFYRSAARVATFEGLYGDALKWAKKALELAPDDPLNLTNLAMVYVDLGEFKLAETLLLKSQGNTQNNLISRAIWHRFYWYSGQLDKMDDYAQSLVAKVEASQSYSEKQFALSVYKAKSGMVKVLKKQYPEAISLIAASLDCIDSAKVNFHLYYLPVLSYVYLKSGQVDLFEQTQKRSWDFIKQLKDTGGVQRLMLTKSMLLTMEGKEQEAITLLTELVDKGWQGYMILKNTPQFELLEAHQAYQVLLANLRATL